MDPYIIASLVGGMTGIFVSFLLIISFAPIFKKRGAAPKRRVDPSAWEPIFGRAHGNWYRAFAWRPVSTLDRGWVWLRPVWRRRVYKHSYLPGPSAYWFQNLVELKYIFD